ncbi:dihydrodipicolinate synthase family protein [uncultured Cohaesibacter sp.]|uniref:dihydrodipicolinate synthase family protein n=1 Tax=uncultured Cohaesibacter sp. TaxID=1002546 RepID=UPI002930922B|nr:dihydrodipicolinate synthase family protein [uncultured Cohaesibacter sp.]
MDTTIFTCCMPALMTPCKEDRSPDYDALVKQGQEMIEAGMGAVVYCGSMGDWPLLSDAERKKGVELLVEAGLPVVAGLGAINSKTAADHAAHAQKVGAKGLMIIPRQLSRTSVYAAQRAHFKAVLEAAPDLPGVIYNSPYYGFATKADLFFDLRAEHPNLVGFKEFGGAAALTYAAETMTSGPDDSILMVGVDTAVYHGYVNCGAQGAITGIGNILPKEVLLMIDLCKKAVAGDALARKLALELEQALSVLSTFDEGPDLVLHFKHMMVLRGKKEYALNFNETDVLSESQKGYVEKQLALFDAWYASWAKQPTVAPYLA